MSRKLEIKSGDKYGRLTIIKEVEPYIAPNGDKRRKFECLCNCGNTTNVKLNDLTHNRITSCGCLNKEMSKNRLITHGLRYHPLYKTWCGLKQRCYNTKYVRYNDWGGRGIKVCDRWLNSFENFLEDMGNRPNGYSIDRIDNDGNYEPNNCRWADNKTQRHNQRERV
jgi:hypothetical protein